MVRVLPVEGVLLDDVGEPRLVGEEEGEVGGQDAVFHVTQHLGHGVVWYRMVWHGRVVWWCGMLVQ